MSGSRIFSVDAVGGGLKGLGCKFVAGQRAQNPKLGRKLKP